MTNTQAVPGGKAHTTITSKSETPIGISCAECGEPVAPGRKFCGSKCSVDFFNAINSVHPKRAKARKCANPPCQSIIPVSAHAKRIYCSHRCCEKGYRYNRKVREILTPKAPSGPSATVPPKAP